MVKRKIRKNCFKISIISIIQVLRLKDDLFNKGVKGQKLEKKRHPKLLYIKTIFIYISISNHIMVKTLVRLYLLNYFRFKTVEFTGTILSTSKLNGCVS